MMVDISRQEVVDKENVKKGYSVSRKVASRLLGVSTRTVDRYVRDDRLSTVTISGRIWLNRGEIEEFLFKKRNGVEFVKSVVSTLDMSIDNRVDSVDAVHPVDRKEAVSSNIMKQDLEKKIEENSVLINKISNTLENFANKLNKVDEITQEIKIIKDLQQILNISNQEYQNLNHKYKKTFVSKYLFLILFLIILSLQPLWLLIHLNKFF